MHHLHRVIEKWLLLTSLMCVVPTSIVAVTGKMGGEIIYSIQAYGHTFEVYEGKFNYDRFVSFSNYVSNVNDMHHFR